MAGEVDPFANEKNSTFSDESTSSGTVPRFHSGLRFGGSLRANVTHTKPFSFELKDQMLLLSRKQRELDAKQQTRRLANSFRAQPMPVGAPSLLPKPRFRQTTVAASPSLQTRVRARKRASFENRLEAKRLSTERRRALLQREEENAEAARLKAERLSTVHRPAPIKCAFKPPPEVPRRPVTRSHTFNFETEKRARRTETSP